MGNRGTRLTPREPAIGFLPSFDGVKGDVNGAVPNRMDVGLESPTLESHDSRVQVLVVDEEVTPRKGIGAWISFRVEIRVKQGGCLVRELEDAVDEELHCVDGDPRLGDQPKLVTPSLLNSFIRCAARSTRCCWVSGGGGGTRLVTRSAARSVSRPLGSPLAS